MCKRSERLSFEGIEGAYKIFLWTMALTLKVTLTINLCIRSVQELMCSPTEIAS